MDTTATTPTVTVPDNPTWRPAAREDSWDNVRDLRHEAASQARLSVGFLMDPRWTNVDLARDFAAKSLLSAEAADHMGERLGGAL